MHDTKRCLQVPLNELCELHCVKNKKNLRSNRLEHHMKKAPLEIQIRKHKLEVPDSGELMCVQKWNHHPLIKFTAC